MFIRNKCKKVDFKAEVEEKPVQLEIPVENIEIVIKDDKNEEEKSEEKSQDEEDAVCQKVEEKINNQVFEHDEKIEDEEVEQTSPDENDEVFETAEEIKVEENLLEEKNAEEIIVQVSNKSNKEEIVLEKDEKSEQKETSLSKIKIEREVTQIVDEIVTSSLIDESFGENDKKEEEVVTSPLVEKNLEEKFKEVVVDVTEDVQLEENDEEIIEEVFDDKSEIRKSCDDTMESIIVEVTSQCDFCEVVDDSVRFFAEEKCGSLDRSKIEKVDEPDTCVKVKEKEIIKKSKEKEISEKLDETQDESSMVSDESLIEKPFKQEEEGKVLSPIPEDNLLKEVKYNTKNEETEGTKPVKKPKKERRKV